MLKCIKNRWLGGHGKLDLKFACDLCKVGWPPHIYILLTKCHNEPNMKP